MGIALLVVLEALEPAERLAFVLHDMFAVPFDDIARIVERSPAATRQLASRARRRVRDATPAADPDLGRQRRAVEAFLAASRAGDFEALVSVLHPDVVLRADAGALGRGPAASKVVAGARTVATGAFHFRHLAGRHASPWSTARWAPSPSPRDVRGRSRTSPSPTGSSPACTSSPTPSGWPASTSPRWRPDRGREPSARGRADGPYPR